MNPHQAIRKISFALIAVTMNSGFLAFTAVMHAQPKSETSSKKLAEETQVKTERGTVIQVTGNDLWVKDDSGEIKHFANIPESARAKVEGRELGIHDLKSGMILERITVTTTSDYLVTTVSTLTGKVWYINPPLSVILTLEDGTNQQFKIPPDQKFQVNGKMVDAWGLKKGMVVHITKVTEVPETRVKVDKKVSGQMPPPPPVDTPILVAESAPTPVPTAQPAQPQPAEGAPKTRTSILFIGLGCLLLLGITLGAWALCRRLKV